MMITTWHWQSALGIHCVAFIVVITIIIITIIIIIIIITIMIIIGKVQ